MTEKMIYSFGAGQTDGSAGMRNLLGGKGANLAEMASLDIPVPPGFTITTQVCVDYLKQNNFPEGFWEGVKEQMARLEDAMGAQFGGDENPLLVSVRSGARDSMPGMMDTVLNLGMNDKTVAALEKNRAAAASRMTATAGSSTCSATWFSIWSTTISNRRSRR